MSSEVDKMAVDPLLAHVRFKEIWLNRTMNYLLQMIGLLLVSSFIISCADRIGPEIEKSVKASSIDGAHLSALLFEEEKRLHEKGHKTELRWGHRKINDGTYQVLAEVKVLDAPKLTRLFEWKAQKTPGSALDNHWLVKADNKDTKRLVARPE